MTDENDFQIKPGPRKQSSRSAEVSIPKNYRGFYRTINGSLAKTKATTGRRSSVKPAKPRTGRFNARGRGRAALARGIGPKQGWRIHKATGNRYRARHAIVKVRVVKLRNAKLAVSRGHLAYLQREDAGVERLEGLDGSTDARPALWTGRRRESRRQGLH